MPPNIPFETRIGMGFDVHPFVPHPENTPHTEQTVTLCGVKVLHPTKLHGHSDADVGYHAIVDALLGALGAGDIGMHFPPSDPQWAGADSAKFLLHAFGLLTAQRGGVVNVDVTFIGEEPKIGPHRIAMMDNIAQILRISRSRVNVKATTTEKLGFTGRGEGLAAQAAVAIWLPVTP